MRRIQKCVKCIQKCKADVRNPLALGKPLVQKALAAVPGGGLCEKVVRVTRPEDGD